MEECIRISLREDFPEEEDGSLQIYELAGMQNPEESPPILQVAGTTEDEERMKIFQMDGATRNEKRMESFIFPYDIEE